MNEESTPLFDRLEVLIDERPHHGPYNMALDEVLLCRPLELPLLRVYRWTVPTVSFGYFEAWQPVAAEYPNRELVRRWTGGGVVDHQHDWSYSLLLPRSEPVTNLPAGESYRSIHTRLKQAMIKVGFAGVVLQDEPNASQHTNSRACFAKPVQHDLLVDDRKVSGAAQRRTRLGLLHQGSVQYVPMSNSGFERLTDLLPTFLAAQTRKRVLSTAAYEAASRLADTKYATPAWLHRL